MVGIGVLIFILIWGFIAIWLGVLLSRLFAKYVFDTVGKVSRKRGLITLFAIATIFFLPIADEIISYPRYYSMCESMAKYQFAPNMDANKVYGRRYQIDLKEEWVKIFPTHEVLSSKKEPSSGVVVDVSKRRIIDTNTRELLLVGTSIRPIRSFLAIPWDGRRLTWLLQPCYADEQPINELNIKRTIDY